MRRCMTGSSLVTSNPAIFLLNQSPITIEGRLSSSLAEFKKAFAKAKHVVALTGAGISAESGVPTFRGSGGLWRKYRAQDLATPSAFASDPAKVWQFYSYRRELVLTKLPNPAHHALAAAEAKLATQFGSCPYSLVAYSFDRVITSLRQRN